MTDNNELKEAALPEAEGEIKEEASATMPEKESEILIPVKFNKEIKSLTVDEASSLAQKGLKYDTIAQDYTLLKDLALAQKKTVPQFLEDIKNAQYEEKIAALTERCGGDKPLAEHIMKLEGETAKGDTDGFEELKRYFPEIVNADSLPQGVVESARLKNRALLDEYLRYRLNEKRRVAEAQKQQNAASRASAGSQIDRADLQNPETAEFLKGLWR